MRYVVAAVITVLICFDLSLTPAAAPDERESMRRLPGVFLVIERIDRHAQDDGLSEETVRSSAQLLLTSNGIRILTFSEFAENVASQPLLDVHIDTSRSSGNAYSFCVAVQLRQRVYLVHRPNPHMWATTSEHRRTEISGPRDIKIVGNAVEELLKEFANDFLAVNPR